LPTANAEDSIPTDEEIMPPIQPVNDIDLTEFKFQKFAATYFQGNSTHQYSRKPLKQSLLPLETQGDQLVNNHYFN